MKYIFKFLPPKNFLQWYIKAIPKPNDWSDLPSSKAKSREKNVYDYSKEELRTYLYHEQRMSCCYCNRLVYNNNKSKIEHFKPRNTYPEKIFDYYNLALSCDGVSRRENDKIFHCDTKKKGDEISILPTSKKIRKQFIYDDEGNIFGLNDEAKKIINTLGLNCQPLINSRFETLMELIWTNDVEIKSSKKLKEELFRIVELDIDHKDQAYSLMLKYMSYKDKIICIARLNMEELKLFIKKLCSNLHLIPHILILIIKYQRKNKAM